MKELYHFNGETGEFVGSSSARRDPMDEGNYLIPANATDAPVELIEGEAALYADGAWSHVEDMRGDTYWLPDGTEITVDTLGHVKPDNALEAKPLPTAQEIRTAIAPISPLQGILTLGETEWGKVLAYRDGATWAEKIVIDNAADWVRTSQNIAFFGHLLDYTDEQMDTLFLQAAQVNA
jgi:hypothetical protein